MDRDLVASELMAVAKELQAFEFPTQDALDRYLKDHPAADKSKHKVKETKKEEGKPEAPAKPSEKKEAPKTEPKKEPSEKEESTQTSIAFISDSTSDLLPRNLKYSNICLSTNSLHTSESVSVPMARKVTSFLEFSIMAAASK